MAEQWSPGLAPASQVEHRIGVSGMNAGGIKGFQTEVCWQLICSGLKMLHTEALPGERLGWGVSTPAPRWIQSLDPGVSPIGAFWN